MGSGRVEVEMTGWIRGGASMEARVARVVDANTPPGSLKISPFCAFSATSTAAQRLHKLSSSGAMIKSGQETFAALFIAL